MRTKEEQIKYFEWLAEEYATVALFVWAISHSRWLYYSTMV